MVNRVKITLNIGVNYPPTSYQTLFDLIYCLLCAAFGAKAIRVITKVGFKEKKLLHSLPFHIFDGDAIFTGAATVSADFFPSLSQKVRPEYAVIEGMKPTLPVPLGRQV